jgi:1-acyl-sn-glycerol-3-phosphate acyltransferase
VRLDRHRRRPVPGGVAAALIYLLVMFLFNELRLLATMSWRRRRRQVVERFMAVQGRRMIATVHRLCGLRYSADIEGAGTLPRRFIMLSNHQSLADIPMLVAAFPRHPPKFIAKRSLFRGIPTLSKCLRYGEHAAINRRGPFRPTRRALVRLAQLDRAPDSGSPYPPCSFAVFPEGTRSRDGKVARFYRAGTRVVAEHAGLPIVAVALDGGTAISRLGTFGNLSGIHYRVKVLAIYPPAADRLSVAAVLDDAHRIIAAQVDAWQAQAASAGHRTSG